jgi:hypothetical protein
MFVILSDTVNDLPDARQVSALDLTGFKDQIMGCAMQQPKQKFTADKWLVRLHNDSDLEYIIRNFQDGLDRPDMISIAEDAVKNPEFSYYRRLFSASMIWGFGGDREAGYGPWRTSRMMASEEFRETLNCTSNLVLAGSIGEAYDKFKIDGCGPAFFTKYFYFLGRAVNVNTCPLILDAMVARSLEILLGKNELRRYARVVRNEKKVIVYIHRVREKYLMYLELIRGWAQKLECAPDDLECFLYRSRPALCSILEVT